MPVAQVNLKAQMKASRLPTQFLDRKVLQEKAKRKRREEDARRKYEEERRKRLAELKKVSSGICNGPGDSRWNQEWPESSSQAQYSGGMDQISF